MLRHPPPPAVRSLVEVKLRGVLSRRIHRIATLEGAVLSLRPKEANHLSPTISVCVLDAQIEARRKVLSILIRVLNHRIKLYLPNERKFDTWLRSLRSSSRWKVSNFYEVGDPIAAGQFATVHSASERVSADLCAVKIVRKPQIAHCNPRVLQFIKREAYVCRIVDHMAVTRVHDVFETPEALFIVMDHYPYTLRDIVSQHKILKECDAAAILKSVLHGVKYLHEHKIVHRDIKPDNILCKLNSPPYNVAICDFGLSNFVDPTARKAASRTTTNPASSIARRRIMDQSSSAAVLDARRFLEVANGDDIVTHQRRFSEDFVHSPASEDISESESGDSHDEIQDPSSPLSAYRNHTQQPSARGDTSSHQSQSFSFNALARLRMRRSPSDARAPPQGRYHKGSHHTNTAAGSYGSTVSGYSGYTNVEPSSEQTDGGGRVRGRRRGGGLGFGRSRTPHASGRISNAGEAEPASSSTRRTRQRTGGVDVEEDMEMEMCENEENDHSFAPNMDKFTLTSAIGTPCYVAPEIVERERYGRPVDVWGCGLLLFLMLSGRLPFNGRDSSETLERIRQCELKMEGAEWKDVSFGARSLVRGMLQKDPRRRITVEQALAHAWIYEASNEARKGSDM